MNLILNTGVWCTFLALAPLGVSAQEPETEPLGAIYARLSSAARYTRSSAKDLLVNERARLARKVGGRLKELSRRPDSSFESELHLLLEVAGEWRIEEVVPELTTLVGFELDRSTFPAGDKHPAYAYFPAAHALSRIAGPYVCKSIVRKLLQENGPKIEQICLWVLFRAYGPKLALLILQADERAGDRLAGWENLLAKGEALLVF